MHCIAKNQHVDSEIFYFIHKRLIYLQIYKNKNAAKFMQTHATHQGFNFKV